MKRYSQEQEENIRTRELVREWQQSGLLASEQASRLTAELPVELRRTGTFFRLLLFSFTTLIVFASLALVAIVLDISDREPLAFAALVAGLACIAIADYLIGRFRLYRFGVEEAFAVSAVLSFIVAVVIFDPIGSPEIPALMTAAIGSCALYMRYGYVYAAVASISCAAAIPFQTDLPGEGPRIVAALMVAVVFIVVRGKRRVCGDDFPGDDYAILQAALWAGLYVAVNLKVTFDDGAGLVYWCSYALSWILPVAGLRIALRDKDRWFIDVNLAMLLVAFATNKQYLGLPQKPWDPIAFGVLLIASAMIIRRWLSRGVEGQRYGFTPIRLLARDRRSIAVVGTLSAALQTQMPASEVAAPNPDFGGGGGRSGGAGASGEF